eukprot:gene24546-10156_t
MRLEGVLATAVLLLGLCTPALGGDGGSDEGHLFAKGSDALSWDSDELTRIRNLHNANVFDDKEVFLAAENLATYLGLEKVNAVHMPMPLTFVFLGFTGDGNHKIDIDEEEVAAWFEGLDHILPHTRVELSELACSEDGYCTGMVHGRSSHTPVHSFVHLNFTCQVVIVTRLDVMSTFEHAIHTFSRPVDPQLETGAHQVDVNKMEAFVDNFVASIGLDSSYTILVLNPTWVPSEPVYGYRQGVSSQETGVQISARSLLFELSIKIKEILEPQMPKAYSGTAWMERASTLNKFGRTDSSWHSERWVKAMEGYLREEQTYRNKMLRSLEDTVGGAAIVQAVRVLRALRGPIGEAIREEIIGDPFTLYANIYSRFQTLHPAEDCLVSNWVGRGRWLFIDLTSAAGGYEWGPAMGGDGVVHGHTLPTLDKYFDKLRSKKKALVEEEATSGAPGGKIKQEMQQYKNQHLASIANQRYQAYMMDRQRSEMASRAPGAKPLVADVENDMWNRIQREALVKVSSGSNVLCWMMGILFLLAVGDVKWHSAEALVKGIEYDLIPHNKRDIFRAIDAAELDMLERYATHHCKDREDPPKICAELRDDVEKQRMNLARMSSSKKPFLQSIKYDLFPQHKWDIFGAIDEVALDDEGVVDEATHSQDLFMWDIFGAIDEVALDDEGVVDEATRSQDLFMADLSSVLSRAMRHVLAPPTAAWRHRAGLGQTHDTASQFYKQVNFDLYIIMEGSRARAQDDGTIGPLDFQIEEFEKQVKTLALGNQAFKFKVSTLDLMDDAALAVAFSMALRTTDINIPTSDRIMERDPLYFNMQNRNCST